MEISGTYGQCVNANKLGLALGLVLHDLTIGLSLQPCRRLHVSTSALAWHLPVTLAAGPHGSSGW